MLLRMYMRWFENKGFCTETLDLQDGEEAGIKAASLMVKGGNAFGYLKRRKRRASSGTHITLRFE